MLIENEVLVERDPADVYRLMLDVDRVIPCLPGAELVGADGDAHQVRLHVKLGPMSLSYDGSVRIVERDDATHRATMEAEAAEKRGQGSARATMTMAVGEEEAGRSRLAISSDVVVTGRVAQMGRGIMQDVASRMLQEMAGGIERELAAETSGEGSAASEPAARAQSSGISGLAVVRGVLWLRLRRLFGRAPGTVA